jgi:hypothetical protein
VEKDVTIILGILGSPIHIIKKAIVMGVLRRENDRKSNCFRN